MNEILGDRYELLEQIGSGGMAVVYLARDTFLDRLVAVKVLRDEYANEQDFTRRFHREAKAVASLSHPNIINIYDFGESGHKSYLVMEYIEGRTLKDIIKERSPLPLEQILDISQQICAGISEAHSQNIIHKDIKPHNILIDKNGIVKVTDFGIAQAANNITITHNKGILGSAHYFSPEQARGDIVDWASDIYSIGVVMYEMVVGKVPFTGENPVTVALKHIQMQPQPPSSLGIDVDPALEWIIMKALSKNPKDRFHNVSEMEEELATIQLGRKRNNKKYDLGKKYAVLETSATSTEVVAKATNDETRIVKQDYLEEIAEEAEDKPRGKKIRVLNLFLFLLIAIALGTAGFFSVQKIFANNELEVPNVIGEREIEAERKLLSANLTVVYDEAEYDNEMEAGLILRQTPTAGTKVKEGREITLVVSLGESLIEVPQITGMNKNEAEATLNNKKLILGQETTNYSPDVPEGDIIIQIPRQGEMVSAGTKIDYTISLGPTPKMVTIPDLSKKTLDEAKAELRNAGLVLGTVKKEESYTHETGTIIRQSLAADGQTMQDTVIDLVVSDGPGPDVYKVGKVEMLVPETGTMVLELVDDDGSAIIYSKEWLQDDYLSTEFTYKGSGYVNIYCNNQLVETIPLS